ncbi:hypothetical protein, partial [Anaerotruncus colihominis]|uniref:hypothetical protein n=1 Tax=Anaerotruncus colihominis TaxID=169435 RepID=UPI00210C820F
MEIAYDLVTEHGIKPEDIRDIIVGPFKRRHTRDILRRHTAAAHRAQAGAWMVQKPARPKPPS